MEAVLLLLGALALAAIVGFGLLLGATLFLLVVELITRWLS